MFVVMREVLGETATIEGDCRMTDSPQVWNSPSTASPERRRHPGHTPPTPEGTKMSTITAIIDDQSCRAVIAGALDHARAARQHDDPLGEDYWETEALLARIELARRSGNEIALAKLRRDATLIGINAA